MQITKPVSKGRRSSTRERRNRVRACEITRNRPARACTPLQAEVIVRSGIQTQEAVEAIVRHVAAQAGDRMAPSPIRPDCNTPSPRQGPKRMRMK